MTVNAATLGQEGFAGGRRTCLLVLGMHRSGTSALTRVLSLAGAALPATILPGNFSNLTGHRELVALRQYSDRMLASLATRWDDWREIEIGRIPAARRDEIVRDLRGLVEAEFPEGSLFVVKDPRTCRFAPLFLEALEQAGIAVRVVLVFRNPIEVAESLERRDGMRRVDAGLLWLRHVLDAERATRGVSRAVVSFETLLAGWRGVLGEIAARTGIAWRFAPEEIAGEVERYLDGGHRHHARTAEDLLLDPDFRPWLADAYAALSMLERGPDAAEPQAVLDRLSRELRHAGPILARLRDDARSDAAALARSLDEKDAAAAALRAERDALAARLRESRAAAGGLEARLQAAREAAAAARERQKARLAKRDRKLRALKRSLSWRVTRPLRRLSAWRRRRSRRSTPRTREGKPPS